MRRVKLGTRVIELLQPLSQSSAGSTSVLHHFAIAVDNIDATVSALRAKGVEFDQEISMAFPDLFERWAKNIFFKGPSGEAIE